MSKPTSYSEYLKSDVWANKRSLALERTGGFCQFCGAPAVNVHHVSYPKQLGTEHPNSLIPICKRCHDISHGVQKMKSLIDVQQMAEITPSGSQLKYLISGARIYASDQSWAKALQVPKSLLAWFKEGLPRTAMLRKNTAGGELEALYLNTPVYRWHVVAELLRSFDRSWYEHGFKSRGRFERIDIEKFHSNYEGIVSWGYDLQERALGSALVMATPPSAPVTQDVLLDAIRNAVAPRLHAHDAKINEHDLIISEIKGAVPTLRDEMEFISIKQAINEQGLDSTLMPLYPRSKENLSGLAGGMLKLKNAETGVSLIARVDGQSFGTEMKTYRRGKIYDILKEILSSRQESLF